MVLVFLPWLVRGRDRPEYAALLEHSSEDGLDWEVQEMGRFLIPIILARFAFNAVLRGPTARLAQRRGTDEHLRDGLKLLEEMWVTLGNLVMLASALYVTLYRNGGCWFFSTASCLTGWPNQAISPEVRLYYQLELAWYCHMLLKPVLRYGLKDGRDMMVHHFASLALILVSYGTQLMRIGTLVLATFAISNPLLHIAKICNQLSLGPLKLGGFVVFAAAFFLSRVLLVPVALLKTTLIDSRWQMPHGIEDFPALYWGVNVLLLLLYAMQLMWMRGIVRVIRSAVRHGADAASHMSAKVDPAKRYAVGAEPQQAAAAAGDKLLGARPASAAAQPKTPSPPDVAAVPPAAAAADSAKDK